MAEDKVVGTALGAKCRHCKRTHERVYWVEKPDGQVYWHCADCGTDNWAPAEITSTASLPPRPLPDGPLLVLPSIPEEVQRLKERWLGVEDEGRKLDLGGDKFRYDLLHRKAVEDLVAVLTYGARKYSPDNWKKVRHARRRYRGALLRHLNSWQAGEVNDSETGLPHLAHAQCCLMFLAGLDADGVPDDAEPCGFERCEVCYPGGPKPGTVYPDLSKRPDRT